MKLKTILFEEADVKRALSRIAHEITEHNRGCSNVVLVGIKTRGVPMANILKERIYTFENVDVEVGSLDITLYRDDLTEKEKDAKVTGTHIPFDINGKDVILCDDVIFTGRTVRAAIDAIIRLGRPKSIQLAVLIDRGHRELPIKPDYVGKNVPTSTQEMISVKFAETDGTTSVVVNEK